MKKITAILLAMALIIGTINIGGPLIAHAAGTATIKVESVSAKPDSTIEVAVNIENNPGIASAGFTLSFDESLTLIGAKNGEAFSELTMTPPAQLKKTGSVTGSCRFAWLGSDDVTEDGEILHLTFQVAADAEENKECGVALSCADGDILNASRSTVDVSIENGKILVINYMPGDVDDSGNINMLDVLMLCQFYVDGCKYDPDGYAVDINPETGDVDASGNVNMLDVLMLCQYYVDGCQYDPNGYGVILLPGKKACAHTFEHIEAKAATCVDDGNIEYWHCMKCNTYYADAAAKDVISQAYTVEKAKGHNIVIDEAVAPTEENTGLTEGAHCSNCDYVEKEQVVIEKLQPNTKSITYNIVNEAEHPYLATLDIDTSSLEYSYKPGEAKTLKNLELGKYGYTFDGWFDGFGKDAVQIKEISASANIDIELYAHVTETVYTITYNVLKTPVESLVKITDDYDPYHFTVSTGKPDLPNPEMKNYVFLGWYDNDGQEVKEIPVGTAKNITLTPYYTSMRYLAKANMSPDKDFFVEDYQNNVIYYVTEIGTIENIPLANLWDNPIMSRAGLDSSITKTVSVSISETQAETVAEQLTKATTDSNTWTLSKDWNSTTQVNKEVAEEQNMTQEQATTQAMSTSGTMSLTNSFGGKNSTTKTNGTTTLTYDTKEKTKGNSQELDIGVSGEIGLQAGVPLTNNGAGAKVSGHLDGKFEWHDETTTKTGTEKTKVNTTVKQNESSWNSELSNSFTQQASTSTTMRNVLSKAISEKYGYGESYAEGGSDSQSQQFTHSSSESLNSSTTLTYNNQTVTTDTQTFHANGNIEGKYMLVQAGTAHVFAVVGFDIASKSFFTYTYNVMDDTQYQYLDYSPLTSNFDDCQYSVLPFEIPGFVLDYALTMTAQTEGLGFRTNSETGTATVTSYNGTSEEVSVPKYVVINDTAYKVTGLSTAAFAGKNISAVLLSDFIEEIPDGAFKNCTELKNVSGNFTRIGSEAFSGCEKLENFSIASGVSSIGTDAFKGVQSIKATVSKPDIISSIVNSGANNITIDISSLKQEGDVSLAIPEIKYFELSGGNKTFTNIQIESKAETTVLKQIKIVNDNGIPLDIYSENLTLDTVYAQSEGYVMMLHSDSTKVSLINDSNLVSDSGKTIVCKNPDFASVSLSSVDGYLRINGDVYLCGTITGIENLDLTGEIVMLSESEFDDYIKGVFSVTFDANGGDSLTESTRNVFFGSAYGELPIPKRSYYTFNGWFTAADGGQEVTSATVFNSAENITLYAHWTENSVSGWTLASEVPSTGKIIEGGEKWVYTKTETTESATAPSSMSGWTETGSYWKTTGSGYVNYATFPSTFDTGNWYYTNFAKSALSAYDNGSTKREVENVWGGYVYWHWMYSCADNGTAKRAIYHKQGTGPDNGYGYNYFYAFDSTKGNYSSDNYYCNSQGITNYIVDDQHTSNAECGGATRWFRFDYYTSYYTDYQKIYQYKKVTNNLESFTPISNGGQISNVTKYVRYIPE